MNCFLLFSLLYRSLEEHVNDDQSRSLEEYFIDSLQKPYWPNMCFARWASDIRSYLGHSATLIQILPSKNKAITTVLRICNIIKYDQ